MALKQMLCGGGNASGFIAINALAVTHGLLARCRLPVTNRGKRVSDYFRAGTTVYLELWSSFPTTPFVASDGYRSVLPTYQKLIKSNMPDCPS